MSQVFIPMKFAATVPNICLALISVIASFNLLSPAHAQVKLPSGSTQVQPIDPNDPNNLQPTGQTASVLSLVG